MCCQNGREELYLVESRKLKVDVAGMDKKVYLCGRKMKGYTMKKLLLSILFCGMGMSFYAAQTTYTFTSKSWASKVGTVVTDGKTDGWTSIEDGQDYTTGYNTPQGLTSQGIRITKSMNAEAQSVIAFTDVRKLVLNYCTNNKKGKGDVVIWVGDNDSIVTSIAAPSDNGGLNREVEIVVPFVQTGKIRLKVKCTENSIYINEITIKASNASPSVGGLTKSTFQLVTNISQLADNDEVMIGVSGSSYNYVMGVYDESVSRNNIHAVRASYSADRNTVDEVAEAVYRLRVVTDTEGGSVSYTLQDYTDWYIVASGGNPNRGNNNYLTIWDTVNSPSYGRFGYWAISIADDGTASVVNEGSSRSKMLQFNNNGGTPIFACYENASQTAVTLYRRISVPADDEPYIQPAFVNFGTALLTAESISGTKSIEVNAINLTAEISASLKDGSVFSLDKTELDRDGDRLSISYQVSAEGAYKDTVVLRSGSTQVEVPVFLYVNRLLTIAEARQLEDQSTCYLQEVVVTKKYDKYIFVQDSTGSILLFDGGNVYGKELSNGYRLQGVTGKFQNYYGNPSVTLSAAFRSAKGEECAPVEQSTALTEDDVCRFIVVRNTTFNRDMECLVGGVYVPLYALFGEMPTISDGMRYDVSGIVYNYEGVVLCPVSATETGTGVDAVKLTEQLQWRDGVLLNPQGLPLHIYSVAGTLLLRSSGDVCTTGWASGTYLICTDGLQPMKLTIW